MQMPRLTDRDYLFFRAYLCEVWQARRQASGLISTRDQYYLHRYFRLGVDLTLGEALAHRQQVTHKQPSLPQCAGRALRHFADPRPLRAATGSKRIVVYPLLRPEPDIKLLAQSLLATARSQRKRP